MVVDYFHVFGTVGAFRPFKTNAPLLVDTDAVLPLTIAAKRFKVVAGEGGKILQGMLPLWQGAFGQRRGTQGIMLCFCNTVRSLFPLLRYLLDGEWRGAVP